MHAESISLPLAQLPLPSEDPLDVAKREIEANLPKRGGVPWVVLAASPRQRYAVVRADLSPAACARAERALAQRPEILWTALYGEQILQVGYGPLRCAFARRVLNDGAWEVWLRPFLLQGANLTWLDEWSHHQGDAHPRTGALAPLFPEAEAGGVRFVALSESLPEPTDRQPLPVEATEDDIARLAGLWLESFFFARGFVPPSAIRVTESFLEVYLLPRTSPPHAATDLALRLAQSPETAAVGTFGRDTDRKTHPPCELIQALLEWRGGAALRWRRRFRVMEQNKARWVDAVGEVVAEPGRRRWLS